MKKACIVLGILIFISSVLEAEHFTFNMEKFFRNKKSRYPSSYDRATYLNLLSFGSFIAVQNGYSISVIQATTPSGETDTLYSGIVKIRAVEENQNNSVTFYPYTGMGFTPDTIITLTNGSNFFLIKNSESENVIFQAYSPTGELKSSYPITIYFEPAGGRAVALDIRGIKKAYAGEEEGFSLAYAVAVDENGRIDPTYMVTTPVWPIAFDVVSVGVVSESTPNNSVVLQGFFSDESGEVVDVPMISGIGFFTVNDNEIETATIQAISTASPRLTDSPPHNIEFLPPDVGINLLLHSFTGYSTNVGFPKNFIALAGTESGPDVSNNSTEVLVSLVDITGYSPSFSLEPRTWGPFIAGVRGFTFTDDEPDSFGLITKAELRGEPELNPPAMLPVFTVYPPGRAVRLRLLQQSLANVGDTAKVLVLALDEFGSIDTNYNGYIEFELSDPGSFSSMTFDYNNDMRMLDRVNSGILRMIGGKAIAYVYDTEPEEVYINVHDAETNIFTGMGYGYLGGEESGPISFSEPSENPAVSYTVSYLPPVFFIYERYIGTITAVDERGVTVASYNGVVRLTADSRHIMIEPDSVVLRQGIGTFMFVSTEPETVELDLLGELGTVNLTLVFLSIEAGGVFLTNMPEMNILANSEIDAVVAVQSRSGINNYYSGECQVIVTEEFDNGSVIVPSTITITNGVGRATFFDSEPERVTIELRSADGRIAPTTISFIVKLDLVPDIPALATVSDGIDTIFFRTYDGTSTLYPYTSPTPACSVVIIEQFPNGSVSLSSPQVILRDGIGYILIEDTEPESVWVTLLVYDEYLSTEFETGTIYFSSTGIAENLKPLFSIKPPYPNPFNSFVVIPVEGYANEVTFEIYNALGERIRSVYSGAVNGRTRLVWNGRDENDSPVPSGLYFYKVTQGEHIYTGRLVYLK